MIGSLPSSAITVLARDGDPKTNVVVEGLPLKSPITAEAGTQIAVQAGTLKICTVKSGSSLPQATQEACCRCSKAKEFFKGLLKGFVGFLAIASSIALAPLMTVAYCLTSLVQLCRGECGRAGTALFMAITTLIWYPFAKGAEINTQLSHCLDTNTGGFSVNSDFYSSIAEYIRHANDGLSCNSPCWTEFVEAL